jgi:putative serine protease PepD
MTDTGASAYMSYEPPSMSPDTGYKPGGSSDPRPPQRNGGWIVALIAAALFVGAIFGAGTTILTQEQAPVAVTGPVIAEQPTPSESAIPAEQTVPSLAGLDAAAVGAAVIPSVVSVEVGTTQDGQFLQTASGSGVAFDTTHIITNHHVVDGSSAVQVVLSDGRVYQAEVVGSDPITDVAVLSVAVPDLSPLPLGSTTDLIVGMPAIAVGSPLGLEGGPSLSVGVISGLGREVQTTPEVILYGMIQTDAPITNGSSGGALVDRTGALIGITTAVGASELGIEGIGFATPIEIVKRIATDIIETGSASHSLLGILGSTSYQEIGDQGVAPVGVTIEEVTAGSAAGSAGIRSGQIITAAGGVSVRTMDELITVLRLFGAGDTITLDFVEADSITLQLGAR